MTEALRRLFAHWAPGPRRVRVAPLDDYVSTVYLKMKGQSHSYYDRHAGDWALLVNTDSNLYQVMDASQPPGSQERGA